MCSHRDSLSASTQYRMILRVHSDSVRCSTPEDFDDNGQARLVALWRFILALSGHSDISEARTRPFCGRQGYMRFNSLRSGLVHMLIVHAYGALTRAVKS